MHTHTHTHTHIHTHTHTHTHHIGCNEEDWATNIIITGDIQGSMLYTVEEPLSNQDIIESD